MIQVTRIIRRQTSQKYSDYSKRAPKPEVIVIVTGRDPKFVMETVDEYMKLKNSSVFLSEELVEILANKGFNLKDPAYLKKAIARLADGYRFLDQLQYLCAYCKKPVHLSPHRDNKDWAEDLNAVIDYLSKNNVHPECLKMT